MGVRKRGTLSPAAWYPDPTDERRWQWWDGAAWTEHRVPRSIVAETPPSMPGPVTAGHLAPVENPGSAHPIAPGSTGVIYSMVSREFGSGR